MCAGKGDKKIVDFEIVHKSVLSMVVCTAKTRIEALNWARMHHPAGEKWERNWTLPKENSPSASADEKTSASCTDHPLTHKHYLFEC